MASSNSNQLHNLHRSRMRAKICTYGTGMLCDHELLEILLFYAIPRRDTNALAHRLLERFCSLDKLFQASIPELQHVCGIGENAAVLMKAVFELHLRLNRSAAEPPVLQTFDEIGSYLLKLYANCDTERLMLFLFDKQGHIERKDVIAEGTAELAAVNMKKILACSVSASAVSAVLAHNHPSGMLQPSYEDKRLTLEVDELLRSLDIRLIDHFILTRDRYLGIKRHCYGMSGESDAGMPFSEKSL